MIFLFDGYQESRYKGPMALNDDRIITLNCGLGRDSLTMLVLCFEGRLEAEIDGERVTVRPEDLDAVLFSDTGREWRHTYRLIPIVRELCERHGVRFDVLAKGDERYHRRPDIMSDFQSRATVASLGKGDCTDNHKIQPIRRWLSLRSQERFGRNNRSYSALVRKGEAKPHVTLIGIAADETSRLLNGGHGPAYVTEAYPLVTMGITKAAETPHLARWELGDVRKSGCYMCPYQPAGWFWALSVTEPADYADVVAYEAEALARNPRMAATGFKRDGRPMTIPEVVERWRSQNPDATVSAVLAKEYTRCTKDARAEQRAAFDAPVTALVRKKSPRPLEQLDLF